MLRRDVPLICLLSALAACAGRSTLPEPGESQAGGGGASGSATASSSGASGGEGGAGGAALPCPYLALTGEPISYTSAAALHGITPALVRASETSVMAIFGRLTVNDPANPPATIGHVVFEPWGDWPQSLGSILQTAAFGGDNFAAAPAATVDTPAAAVLFYLPNAMFPDDVYLAPTVEAGTSYDPFPEGVGWDAAEPVWMEALARGSAAHLGAYQVARPTGVFLRLAQVSDSLRTSLSSDIACANQPFAADLAPTPGGYLLATASGAEPGACHQDTGNPGEPNRVDVYHVEPGPSAIFATSFPITDGVAEVRLAARAGGAWLAWQERGSSSFAPPPVHAIQLDAAGSPLGPVFDLTHDGESQGPWAIVDLGGNLAFAWVDTLEPSSPTLRVPVFDGHGSRVAEAALYLAPKYLFAPSLSLLSSPDERQLLLAWSDLTTGAAPAFVEVARFSCLDGAPPP